MNKSTRSILRNIFLHLFLLLIVSSLTTAQNYKEINKLKRALTTSTTKIEKVDIFNKLGKEYYDINDSLQEYAEKALQLARKSSYKLGEINAYINLGFYYNGNLRNIEKAVFHFDTAIVICQKSEKEHLAEINLKIAQSFNYDKQAKHAKKYLLSAYNALSSDKNNDNYRTSLYLLTDVYGRLRMQDSVSYFLNLYAKNIENHAQEGKLFQQAELSI